MLIIGESLNGTIETVGRAILDRNETYLRNLVKAQHEFGADYLDVNAGVAGGNEVEDLPWLTQIVQEEVLTPLMIDSANPEALKAALSVYRHSESPILNSVSGEEEKWNKLCPVLEEKGCKVVVLLMDDRGIPKTVDQRMSIAQILFTRLTKLNIPPEDIYFDPLLLSVAVEPAAGVVALETIRRLRSSYPDSHVICGLSNVSMGLPGRKLINRTFLTMAICAGMDALLLDVRDQALLSSIYASKILINQDPYCLDFLNAYREKRILV